MKSFLFISIVFFSGIFSLMAREPTPKRPIYETEVVIPEIFVENVPEVIEPWEKFVNVYCDIHFKHIIGVAKNTSIQGAKHFVETNPAIGGFFYVTEDCRVREKVDESTFSVASLEEGDIVFFSQATFRYSINGSRGNVEMYFLNRFNT